MNALLIKLLNMSAAGSVLILAVVVLRALLKKAPRWIICAMWALVAIRLICPISISSPVSAFRATPSIVSESGEVEVFRPAGGSEKPLLAVDTVQIERPQASSETIREIPGTSYAVTQRSRDAYLPPLVQAYLLGLTAMLLYALVSTLLLRKKVSVSLRQRGNIRVCDEVASPFILGIFRPVIYLPSSLSEEEKRFVLAHELAHLRRLDHVWKPLGFLILSVHWFNPFCWLAYVLLCRDIELACDEKVIRELGRAERAAYSQTLLNCSAHRILAACPVAFGETDVKTRVKAVLNYKKPAFWIILSAVLACVVLIVCFAADPMQKQDLSFLNYKNAIPLIGQNDTAPYAFLFEEGTGAIQPGVADAKALARYLASVSWTERRAPEQALESPGSIEFDIEDGYYIKVYRSPRLAYVLYNDEKRFYRIGAGDYEAALATFIPAPSTEPDRRPEQTFDTELILSDPLSFLLSFSNAEIVTLIDNTGRSYEKSGKSFHEIITAQTWTAQTNQGFTTVEPSRQIYLRGDDYWCLSFEQTAPDSEMTCCAHNLLSSQSMLISFDCGENLMDELMAWALARQQESSAGIDLTDPEAILLSFSNAQVVTVIDETDRSYKNTGRNFAEIVSAQTWSAHQTEGFPASYPDRLIVMIHGDWELRIEEATGECLYMVFPKDSDANSLVTYLDCGKNLMDELMPWATYEAGKPIEEAKPRMTLNDVYALADKGLALTWSDLLAFEGEEIGSGQLIWRFPINDTYCLEAYDGELDGPPEHVLLLIADENGEFRPGPGLYIDILTQDVYAYLSGAHTRSITVTSGGVTVEPSLYLLNETIWTDYGWLVADGVPLAAALEDADKIPTLTLASDFIVRFDGYSRKSGLQLYDERFQPLREDWYGDTAVNWLAPGSYYGVIETFGPAGRYIASEGSSEESVYRAVFRLNVDSEGAEPYAPEKAVGLTTASLHTIGEDWVITDAARLAKLETWLKNAEPLPGGAGCPFGSVLTLKCADGNRISCCPAEDSCGVVFANGVYYRFAADNKDFWMLFGVIFD